jgi:hypothetical protein
MLQKLRALYTNGRGTCQPFKGYGFAAYSAARP